MVLSGSQKALRNQRQLPAGCRNSKLRLFLKGVQHVNNAGEAHSVNCAVSVAVEVISDLQNACPSEAFERFGIGCLAAALGFLQGTTHPVAHLLGKAPEVVEAATDPSDRLGCWSVLRSRHGFSKLMPNLA